jgi:hypothetical protein
MCRHVETFTIPAHRPGHLIQQNYGFCISYVFNIVFLSAEVIIFEWEYEMTIRVDYSMILKIFVVV